MALAVEVLRTLAPDVLAVQELDRGADRSARVDQPGVLAEQLEMRVAFGPAVRRGHRAYGIALLSRAPLEGVELVCLPGPDEPRVALLAEIECDGRRWSLATAHLTHRGRGVSAQLQAVLDALARRPLPRVLVGDLNIEPERLLPWTTAEGFTLAPGGPTFPAHAPRRRIDHVAVAGAHLGGYGTVRLPVGDHLAAIADVS